MEHKTNSKVKKQLLSFKYALCGLLSVFNSEAHMRFHLVTTIYVVAFSLKFYELSFEQWALLVLTISAVWITEIINTSIERLSDTVTTQYDKNIGFVKDTAASAVLIAAIASVVVAFFILFDIKVFKDILTYFTQNTVLFVVLILSFFVALVFVAFKPSKYPQYFKALTNKLSNKN